MDLRKKIMIIAPFWGNEKHVGHKRIERFIRWTSGKGFKVIIVNAGYKDLEIKKDWGLEITIKDPTIKLGFNFTGGSSNETRYYYLKSLLRKVLIFYVLPDVLALWSKKVVGHPLIQKQAGNVEIILSSSPPESAHIAAYNLAKGNNAKLVIDMRDGWLDDSLSKLLNKIPFRKKCEASLENKILKRADYIFVTSIMWKQLLNSRLTFTKNKTIVLTNGYPINFIPMERTDSINNEIILFHTGRFAGSRKSQKISILLDVLLNYSKTDMNKFNLVLLGDLEPEELKIISQYRSKFLEYGWEISCNKAVPRKQMFKMLQEANGLLLLSTSYAAVPSKLYEYIITKKPTLAIALNESAVWGIGKKVPQIFLIDYKNYVGSDIPLMEYFQACKTGQFESDVPQEFSDDYLAKTFLKALGI